MNNYIVYKHTSPSGKVYIGITGTDIKIRWQNGTNYRNCILFNRAIEKYGWDNIKHEILFTGLTKEEAEQKEIELIALYKSNDSDYGYNIENGGMSCGKHSEKTKQKMSKSQIGNHNSLGSVRSDETKRKISQACKGVKHSIEHNKHMGEAHMHPVICIETGIVYCSVKSASEQTSINKNCISHACNGRNKSAGGFHWRFVKVGCAV